MKPCCPVIIRLFLVALSVWTVSPVPANNYRTISTTEGLSNNALFCIHQDDDGYLWLGTGDGLNIWNGYSMELFRAADGVDYFSGNIVRSIYPTEGDRLWVHTNYGLALVNARSREVAFFEQFAFAHKIVSRKGGPTFVLDYNNILHCYDTLRREFVPCRFQLPHDTQIVHRLLLDERNDLFCFTDTGIYLCEAATKEGSMAAGGGSLHRIGDRADMASSFSVDDRCYFIDGESALCSLELSTRRMTRIGDLSGAIAHYGKVREILPSNRGLLIGFTTTGLYCLPDERIARGGEFLLESTPFQQGILSLWQDCRQSILWIGTDGGGLIKWLDNELDFENITFDQLPYSIRMPVRSLFLDRNSNLWCGTKGDGIFVLRNYASGIAYDKRNTARYTTSDSSLADNEVYAFAPSRRNLFWIGSNGPGLNYYSYTERRIRRLPGSEPLRWVHTIIEQNDSLLWVATTDLGAFRCRLSPGDNPRVERIDPVVFPDSFSSGHRLFAMNIQNDSLIWFGSRGSGAACYNTKTRQAEIIRFGKEMGYAANDIFCIMQSEKTLLATGSGLLHYSRSDGTVVAHKQTTNQTIHALQKDHLGSIWLSSNHGIIEYDETTGRSVTYGQSYGIDVLEFSDGAYFRDSVGKTLFFGGINGVLAIRNRHKAWPERSEGYTPELRFTEFIRNNASKRLETLLNTGRLVVDYKESVFSIRFSVVDNINYSNYEFSYNIGGLNDQWVVNDNSNTIHFQGLPPGNYLLRVRYYNKADDYWSEAYTLPIRIIPPLYASTGAKVFYLLLALCLVLGYGAYLRKRYRRLQQALESQYREKISKSKTEAITQITNELSFLVTFILGVCRQLHDDSASNPGIADKIELVEYNVSKINKLMFILNEFKNIQDQQEGQVSLVAVSQTAHEILDLLASAAERRNIVLERKIEPDLIWPTYKDSWLILFNILISAMLSNASSHNTVSVALSHIGTELTLCLLAPVSATDFHSIESALTDGVGPGAVRQGARPMQVDSYIEFLICRNLIERIGGSIECQRDETTHRMALRVALPRPVAETEMTFCEENSLSENVIVANRSLSLLAEDPHSAPGLPVAYLISENREIVLFVGYFLSDCYRIVHFSENEKVFERLEDQDPAIFIYDTSSKMAEALAFIARVKEMKSVNHIPIVVLTSALQYAERSECMKSGADLCLSFPFNIDYLRSSLKQMLRNRQHLEEYYNSPSSTYVLDEGKFIHKEDKIFVNRMLAIIDGNISNPKLSTQFVAEHMGISIRNLYRRLENVTDRKPQHIIRETRMRLAVKLMATSKQTIDEIIFHVGYDNRSTFYKNFRERYGVAPKDYRKNLGFKTSDEAPESQAAESSEEA